MSGEIVLNGLLIGLGLALESFMVALANGLYNAKERIVRGIPYAVTFAVCHVAALAAGYFIVTLIVAHLGIVEWVLTWFAVVILACLGIKMIAEGLRKKGETNKFAAKPTGCIVQSVVASFDAFAVGLTISDYDYSQLAFCAFAIASVILVFYMIGYAVGKKFGGRLSEYAVVLGGMVFVSLAVMQCVSAVCD